MHPAQKHAVLAMIMSVEHMLYNIKQIVTAGEASPVTPIPDSPSKTPDQQGGYLSEEEEKQLDAAMEKTRLAMLAEDEKRASKIWENADRLGG